MYENNRVNAEALRPCHLRLVQHEFVRTNRPDDCHPTDESNESGGIYCEL